MAAHDDEVRAAAKRWRAWRAGTSPDEDYGRRFATSRSCPADRDSATLADAMLAWQDRFGGECPPGFFADPAPKAEEARDA